MESAKTKKIHPHKFNLWVAMASIIMAFSGLISAYLVKMNQSNWLEFRLPSMFTLSTIVILISSITMFFAERAFKEREMSRYKVLITVTAFLGLLFGLLQILGFRQVTDDNILMTGKGSNAAASFLLLIAGLHILHVLGGIFALIFQFFNAFSRKTRTYSSNPIEITALYWHFVDILWIILFVFFHIAKP